jgi:Asp-tRNA(Asn)/Glu-tRNA(Gln) amidotransferase A subunit family amidase
MAMNEKPYALTVINAVAAIKEGNLTCVELLNSCLGRIDRLEGEVKAWALLDREGAQKEARRLDAQLSKGKQLGPLYGIPVGIKDIFYTEGMRTEAGSSLWAGFIPSYDAASVTRLKEAGAIILGKTHTTEFAYFDPAPTRNPWNTDCTPGGSSSGSAAAVAACMCPLALGSQTVGSTLRPASYNGIVGFKPEHGRISLYGIMPMSPTMDHVGIFTRNVNDVVLVLQVLAGYDSRDPHSLNQPFPDYISSTANVQKPHLGLVRQYFFDNAEDEMKQQTEQVAKRLGQAGAIVEEVTLPASFFSVSETRRIILGVEDYTYHQEKFESNKEGYSASVRALLEEGSHIPAVEYARALQSRLQQRADITALMNGFDALITPGAPGAAPHDLTITGNPVMQLPWTTMGIPAINLPAGLSVDGLPLGVQLVGKTYDEKGLLDIARWCEAALDVHLRPPLD